ncbi:MAG: efflux RND transporter periplasmic adaptor subunit, partial [Deltaproteobacteria bacterium]
MTVAQPAVAPHRKDRTEAFARLRKRRRPWWILVLLVLVVAAGVALFVVRQRRAPAAQRYMTGRVTRGDLIEQIRATGTVQPVLQVQVGAQVSGRVASVAVDFNSTVHRGDLLAEIDPTTYRAQVAQVRAQLMSARAVRAQNRANLALAEQNLVRAQRLREQGLNAQADLDAAVAQRDAARATVGVADAQIAQAQASLSSAQTNLAFTRIMAPIDGIVATRSVDPGQTVAASFQTPTLFVIANDLTHMRVIANVDEANIGKLAERMASTARVDAFPRDTFRGMVRELRINPTTTNGVVTYQAVIDVENTQGRLRPGMTATITVVTARRTGVLRVPNAALRYRPSAPAGGGAGRPDGGRGGGRGGAPGAPAAAAATAAGTTTEDATSTPDQGTLYLLRAGQAVRTRVTIGVT